MLRALICGAGWLTPRVPMSHDLDTLLADGVIDEVVARLKSGKEADVWLVRHAGKIVAAKVYRARHVPELQERRRLQGRAAGPQHPHPAGDGPREPLRPGRRRGRLEGEGGRRAVPAARGRRPGAAARALLRGRAAHGAGAGRARPPRAPARGRAARRRSRRRASTPTSASRRWGCSPATSSTATSRPTTCSSAANGPVVIDFPQVVEAAHNSQAEDVLPPRSPEHPPVLRGARSRPSAPRRATGARSGGRTSAAS